MAVTIYHNPRCSKSRQALQLLRDRGIEPEIVDYLKTPPSADEIDAVLSKLGLKPRAAMRAKEAAYREAGMADESLSRRALIDLMAANPIVIERPIVVSGARAAPARLSRHGHGLRGALRPTGQERRAARCGASGKRLDAPCRPDSAALRVAPRRPPASCAPRASRATSRASTVVPATLFGPLLADRTPGRDAGRDRGEKSGLCRPPENVLSIL